MNLELGAEQEAFRAEVRAFLGSSRVQEELARVEAAAPKEEIHPAQVYRWLGERGWLAPNWPPEYGGLGRTLVESAIVGEEMSLRGVPDTVRVNTVDIIGFFILLVGTPEQKRRFLPPIAAGELYVSVLYSEPGVGSDLSALTTRAEPAGDGFRVYGTKAYSLRTQFSSYGLCAARTTPSGDKYSGITLFIVPLDAPGVTVQPLPNITDERFNRVTLDGVEVPRDHVVGRVDDGWSLINAALALERTGLDYYAKSRRWLTALLEHAAASGDLLDPRFGPRLARLDAQVEAARLVSWRMISSLARGEIDEPTAAAAKWYASELGRPIARLGVELAGLGGTLSRWDPAAPARGLVDAVYREAPALTFSGGTSEIMLYVVAAAGLRVNDPAPA